MKTHFIVLKVNKKPSGLAFKVSRPITQIGFTSSQPGPISFSSLLPKKTDWWAGFLNSSQAMTMSLDGISMQIFPEFSPHFQSKWKKWKMPFSFYYSYRFELHQTCWSEWEIKSSDYFSWIAWAWTTTAPTAPLPPRRWRWPPTTSWDEPASTLTWAKTWR